MKLRSKDSSTVPEVDESLGDDKSGLGETAELSDDSLKYKDICLCRVEFRGPLSCCTAKQSKQSVDAINFNLEKTKCVKLHVVRVYYHPYSFLLSCTFSIYKLDIDFDEFYPRHSDPPLFLCKYIDDFVG